MVGFGLVRSGRCERCFGELLRDLGGSFERIGVGISWGCSGWLEIVRVRIEVGYGRSALFVVGRIERTKTEVAGLSGGEGLARSSP
jgi:hypothetical protein